MSLLVLSPFAAQGSLLSCGSRVRTEFSLEGPGLQEIAKMLQSELELLSKLGVLLLALLLVVPDVERGKSLRFALSSL